MKKLYLWQYWVSILLGIMCLFSSCTENEDVFNPELDAPEGYISIEFKAQIPDMNPVLTRAVDPDGMDVHNLKLFCFNSYGLFITIAYADELIPNSETHTGTFKASIPSETAIIHFVANQNEGQYEMSSFSGKSEAEVLSLMEGGSGMMIYWARFKQNPNNQYTEGENAGKVKNIKEQLLEASIGDNYAITLVRNQAKVSIGQTTVTNGVTSFTDKWENEFFKVTGFRTANIHAFGTIAPYPPDGFDGFIFPHEFVTLPADKAMMSDIDYVNTKWADYIFEHENTLDNPVSVIIRGRNKVNGQVVGEDDLFYRVLLQDENGELLPVLRNHHYQINITGNLQFGQRTIAEALVAPATNNAWISVDEWVNRIADDTDYLGVEETHVVLKSTDAGKPYTLHFEATAQPTITWLDNEVAAMNFASTPTYDSNQKKGSVTINLLPMSSSETVTQQSGTLLLKMGKMHRLIHITVVKMMSFLPSWVSSNVYKDAGENITIKFTIPENCPEGLFPFPVLVSVNDLDVRHSAGKPLPVRLKSDGKWYGDETNDLGYKYEYMVERPGVHRLFFESVLPHQDSDEEMITLEAEFFSTLTKKVNFTDTQHKITLPVYNAENKQWGFHTFTDSDGENFQKDEPIYYLLVPQKRGAEVKFEIDLKTGNENKLSNDNDEFFLFSKTLDLSTSTDYAASEINASTSQTSASNGRTILFYPNSSVSTLTMQAVTNKAQSADVVRISSNKKTSYSAKNQPSVLYAGDEYRSAIFELGNYHPFRFAAQVQVGDDAAIGTWATGEAEDPIDNVKLTYEPNQQVNISFDVTSFTGSDNKDVDPFGRSFQIYIDAPMLKLADNLGQYASKIIEDPNRAGRFIYTVADTRDGEKLGSNALLGNAANERKTIPFVKKTICSAGEITLSSQEEEVMFYKKTFKVSNELITGTIKFKNGTNEVDVPEDAFVAFIRTQTNSRIGVMRIRENGQYTLNLRSEYVFDWTDKIELDYKVDNAVYECNSISNGTTNVPLTLESLFTYKNVVLTKAGGTTTP